MTRLVRAFAAAALALTTTAQQLQSDDIPSFEVDIIFPRNETYKRADHIPIVFAIQNMSAVLAIGKAMGSNIEIAWGLMPYRDGSRPSGIYYDMGTFPIPADAMEQNYTVFVDYTNVTAWSNYPDFNKPPQKDDVYNLRWGLKWGTSKENEAGECGDKHHGLIGVRGAIEFSFEWPDISGQPEVVGKVADIMQAPECPAFSASVQLLPNATVPDCPMIDLVGTSWPHVEGLGSPCAIKADKALLSSISSEASRLAVPPATSSEVTTSTSIDGVGALRPMQTALAAACVLGGLVL